MFVAGREYQRFLPSRASQTRSTAQHLRWRAAQLQLQRLRKLSIGLPQKMTKRALVIRVLKFNTTLPPLAPRLPRAKLQVTPDFLDQALVERRSAARRRTSPRWLISRLRLRTALG